jgi:hypothetical protein
MQPGIDGAVRIVLRPVGSPLTVGMAGLAVASLVETGVDLHWTPDSQVAQAGAILIAVPSVMQLLACVFSYLARDGATGAATGALSMTWVGIGLIHVIAAPGSVSVPLGLLLVGVGGVVCLTAAAIVTEKSLAAIVFAGAGLRFVIAGVYQLSDLSAFEHASGIVGLGTCGLAAYAVLAFELEGQRQRPVLPTLRRGAAARAIDLPSIDPERIARETGVRDSA